jgi:hypothetical protein
MVEATPKAIANARVKNDAVDAKTLAHLLPCRDAARGLGGPARGWGGTALVRMRTSLVRMRSRIRAQVHAVLAEHGVATPMSDLLVRREGGCWRNSTCQNSRRVGSKRVCD